MFCLLESHKSGSLATKTGVSLLLKAVPMGAEGCSGFKVSSLQPARNSVPLNPKHAGSCSIKHCSIADPWVLWGCGTDPLEDQKLQVSGWPGLCCLHFPNLLLLPIFPFPRESSLCSPSHPSLHSGAAIGCL